MPDISSVQPVSTHQRLIDSYLEAGMVYGFDNVTLKIIAGMTDIAKPSVYAHFTTFDNLKLAALEYCSSELEKKAFDIDFKVHDCQTLIENFINSAVNTFSEFPLNSYVSLLEQKKMTDRTVAKMNSALNRMISARLLVALDYSVQRGWLDIQDTDTCAEILTPYIRTCLEQSLKGTEAEWENVFGFLSMFRKSAK